MADAQQEVTTQEQRSAASGRVPQDPSDQKPGIENLGLPCILA